MKLSIPALALVLAVTAVGCDSAAPASETAAARVIQEEDLFTFRMALSATGALSSLNDESRTFTVLAATDEGFLTTAADGQLSVHDMLGRPDMKQILRVHVVEGASLMAADLTAGQELTTTAGATLTVVSEGGQIGFDADADGQADAYLSASDIVATNGVVHKVNRVFVPSE